MSNPNPMNPNAPCFIPSAEVKRQAEEAARQQEAAEAAELQKLVDVANRVWVDRLRAVIRDNGGRDRLWLLYLVYGIYCKLAAANFELFIPFSISTPAPTPAPGSAASTVCQLGIIWRDTLAHDVNHELPYFVDLLSTARNKAHQLPHHPLCALSHGIFSAFLDALAMI